MSCPPWDSSYLTEVTKKGVRIRCERQVSAVRPPPDIDYCFAPLKHARLALALAVRQVLRNGLALLGVSQPASM